MTLCPHCGHRLPLPILDGITGCSNCRRVFDSSKHNKMLSLAWVVRKQHISEPDYLVYHHGCSRPDAEFLINFVFEGCYNHEEFARLLKESGYCNHQETRLDRAS